MHKAKAKSLISVTIHGSHHSYTIHLAHIHQNMDQITIGLWNLKIPIFTSKLNTVQTQNWKAVENIKFLLTPMGVLANRSAHTSPHLRSPPHIDVSWNYPAHASAESPSNLSPSPQKSYPKFRNPRMTFENTSLCPPKYSIVRGVVAIPNLFYAVESPYFFLVRDSCQVLEP